MSKGTLFSISIFNILLWGCQPSSSQSKTITDTFEIVNNEEFICFFLSSTMIDGGNLHEITITSEYNRKREIIQVEIRNDTILSISKQELVFSLPPTVEESEIVNEITYKEGKTFLKDGVDSFCNTIHQSNSDLKVEFCNYLVLLKAENLRLYSNHF